LSLQEDDFRLHHSAAIECESRTASKSKWGAFALLEKGAAPSPLPIGGQAKGEDVVRGHVVHIVPLG
jgi:hypothetical protein